MSAEARDPLIGTVVGDRYRIERTLGQGGMGTVYRAEHVELHQPVAIKVLISDVLATETAVARFLREARAAAAIGHPNIVRVHDLGRLSNGRPYLAMELLEGDGLETILSREGRLSPERVAWIVDGAAKALDAIHDLGLVHRDVKPENLFVARLGDGTEAVKLVDFGLVGLTRAAPDTPRLTQTGLVYGTPSYMAPEAMSEKTPDAQWDVYSLAVVAYELLSGYLPIADENPLELLSRRVREDPPSLFERCGISFDATIEEAMEVGLSRFKDGRYRRAGELADALNSAVRGASDEARAAGTGRPGGTTVDVSIRLSADPPAEREAATSAMPVRPGASRREQTTAAPAATTDSQPLPRPSVGTPIAAHAARGMHTAEASGALRVPGMRRRLVPVAALALVGGLSIALAVGWVATSAGNEDDASSDALVASDGTSSEPAANDVEEQGDPDGPVMEHTSFPTVVESDDMDSERGPDTRTKRRRSRSATSEGVMTKRAATPEAPPETSMQPSVASMAEPADRSGLHAEAARLLARGDVGGARERYLELTRSRAADAAAWRGLGVAAERLGRTPEARRAYERYLDLAPDARDAATVRRRLDRLR